jgi:hypothetical protein
MENKSDNPKTINDYEFGAKKIIMIPDDISNIRKFINYMSNNLSEKLNNQIDKHNGVDNLLDCIIY